MPSSAAYAQKAAPLPRGVAIPFGGRFRHNTAIVEDMTIPMRTNGRVTLCWAFSLALVGAVLGFEPVSAEQWRGGPDAAAYPHITVPSEYDPSETVTGAVRSGPRGDEVRLPGGTWVPCGFNCFFTLRNATVDFWRRYNAPH